VVEQGRPTGARKKVCVDAVATGTPGDATVAKSRGGLVSIVSTREYGSQRPAVIIGIDRWMKDHPAAVEGLLAAVLQGGDQVKRREEALQRAAEVSAGLYGETDADGWRRYYDGTRERDRQGLLVDLGGSAVSNLADDLLLFGLLPGSSNLFAASYDLFGDIAHRQYPDRMPGIPPVGDILDTTYLQALAGRSTVGKSAMAAARPSFAEAPLRSVVSRKSWRINFETGRAAFSPDARQALDLLLRDLLVASGTVVEVHGHTDDVGTPKANRALSEARAFAVKSWLETQAPINFPTGRLRVFVHGQENPVAPNATEEGRARNRRVEIVIGTTG
jgi:outer membrane protein OmpA-like peptidoglycan-associated protein